jgi:hypothetical protein
MMKFQCGDRVQYGSYGSGTSTCLLRFREYPDRLLLLTAGHVVLPTFARQGDEIHTIDASGSPQAIGRLLTWTTIDGDPTTDAALIWVCPDLVDARLRLGDTLAELQPPVAPAIGQPIQTTGHRLRRDGSDPKIADPDEDVEGMMVMGPDWAASAAVTYRSQIVTDHVFTQGGDSGSLVVDGDCQVVGMVIGANEDQEHGFTVITPFSALVDPSSWNGLHPELITSFNPAEFVCPLHAAATAPARTMNLRQDEEPDGEDMPVETLDDPVRQTIATALRLHEIGKATPYQISFAGKGKSGGSFGFMQGDLAAGQPIVNATFQRILEAAGMPAAKAQALQDRLSVHTIANPLSPEDSALVNHALSSEAGRALVDAMDQAILRNVFGDVRRCMTAAEASERSITLKALLYMAMWINMSGPPSSLLTWLKGREVMFDNQVKVPPPGELVDGIAMESYLQKTHYFSANPANFKRLRQCAADALAQHVKAPDFATA